MHAMIRCASAALVAAMAFATPTWADPWKDESGHGKHRWSRNWEGDEREIKYRDGDCKVEREWKNDGEYKEKIECDGPRWAGLPSSAGRHLSGPRVGEPGRQLAGSASWAGVRPRLPR